MVDRIGDVLDTLNPALQVKRSRSGSQTVNFRDFGPRRDSGLLSVYDPSLRGYDPFIRGSLLKGSQIRPLVKGVAS